MQHKIVITILVNNLYAWNLLPKELNAHKNTSFLPKVEWMRTSKRGREPTYTGRVGTLMDDIVKKLS